MSKFKINPYQVTCLKKQQLKYSDLNDVKRYFDDIGFWNPRKKSVS